MNISTLVYVFIHKVTLSHQVKADKLWIQKPRWPLLTKEQQLESHFGNSNHNFSRLWGFQLPHTALRFGEVTWKLSLKGFFSRRSQNYIWCLMSKHILRHPIIFCWPNLEKVTYKYMLLSYLWVTTYPLSWLVSQATSLSRHLAKQGFDNWHKVTTMWKASWGLSHWKTHDNPITSKPHSMLSRRLSFLTSGTLSTHRARN